MKKVTKWGEKLRYGQTVYKGKSEHDFLQFTHEFYQLVVQQRRLILFPASCPKVEAMLDKTISAMSSVFIGAAGSTFTEDIIRLRRGWGSASQCDEYLCHGERPNFIADNE